MNDNILVSIVIPVYNTEKYLKECLNSVVGQTYKNLEIIIVDNNSKDNSVCIIEEFMKTDNRIKLFKQMQKGVFLTRKLGIEKATGEYICSIDSDDYIDENYIKILLKNALNTNADFVQCGFKCEGIKNDICVFDKYNLVLEDNKDKVLVEWLYGTGYIGSQLCTKLFKANIIKKTFALPSLPLEKINEGEDVMYFLYYLKKSNSITSINDVLYHYRYRRDSISHNINIKWLITELILINKLTKIIAREYKTIDKKVLKFWNKKYKKNRIRDYLNYKFKI